MDIVKYLPLNTKFSIDVLIYDLRNGNIKYGLRKEVEIECIYNIRKIKLQLYFKEKFAEINESKIEQNDIRIKGLPVRNKRQLIVKGGNETSTNNLLSEKNKQSSDAKECKIYVPHKKFESLSINQIAKEIKWAPEILITILNRKGVLKNGNERVNYSEYDLIKHVIELRYRRIHRKLSKVDTKKLKRLKRKRLKGLKSPRLKSYSRNRRESVYDKMATYGVGKLISIRSK